MSNITFPEILYNEYRDKFVKAPPRHRYYNQTINQVAGTLTGSTYTLDPSMDGILNFCSARLLGGAGSSAISCRLQILPPSGADPIAFMFGNFLPSPAATILGWSIPHQIELEAGSQLTMEASFSVPGVSNQAVFSWMLCTFPRMKF